MAEGWARHLKGDLVEPYSAGIEKHGLNPHAVRVMAEARAIENQAVVALSNRVGPDGQGNDFCGGSGIFGPLGPVAEAGDARTIVAAEIDPAQLHSMRTGFPFMTHRRQGIDHD